PVLYWAYLAPTNPQCLLHRKVAHDYVGAMVQLGAGTRAACSGFRGTCARLGCVGDACDFCWISSHGFLRVPSAVWMMTFRAWFWHWKWWRGVCLLETCGRWDHSIHSRFVLGSDAVCLQVIRWFPGFVPLVTAMMWRRCPARAGRRKGMERKHHRSWPDPAE